MAHRTSLAELQPNLATMSYVYYMAEMLDSPQSDIQIVLLHSKFVKWTFSMTKQEVSGNETPSPYRRPSLEC